MFFSLAKMLALLGVVATVSAALPGQDLPLGSHRPAETDMTEMQGLPNTYTLLKHIKEDKPLVMRKAVTDVWPASKLWTDEYLNEKAGSEDVNVEIMKKEDRVTETEKWKMSRFLKLYKHPTKYYITGDLPTVLRKDLALPKEYKKIMLGMSNPFIWFSSGGTASFLHRDDQWNINCGIAGSKTWFIAHKDYGKELYISNKYSGYGERSVFDVDKVDVAKYPDIQKVKWYNVTQNAGDCVFLPGGWYHAVRSHDRSLAINLWFWPTMRPWTAKKEHINLGDTLKDVPVSSLPTAPLSDPLWNFLASEKADIPPIESQRLAKDPEATPEMWAEFLKESRRPSLDEDDDADDAGAKKDDDVKPEDGDQGQDDIISWKVFYEILTEDKVVQNKKEAIFLWEKVYKLKGPKATMTSEKFEEVSNEELAQQLAKLHKSTTKTEL